MNVSMHDSWNLAWKLKLAIQGVATPSLLPTYQDERRKIAQDLIAFDYEHANAFLAGDAKALAENFVTNIRFISGVGAEYASNVLNIHVNNPHPRGGLKPGALLLPASVTRYIDANPVQIELDIPMLGNFRVYVLTPSFAAAKPFLDAFSDAISAPTSLLTRASALAASSKIVPTPAPSDEFIQPQRYTPVSPLFTYAFVTQDPKADIEIADLSPVLRASPWTFYLDDGGILNVSGLDGTCTEKWVGPLRDGEVAIVNVRPDGYVGSIGRWRGGGESGVEAGRWMEEYYGGFLQG